MKKRMKLLTGISTNVLILGLVSLLTDMSSEMIFPILSLFLTGIGATGAIIGLIEGAAETTASLLKVVSGGLSDRFGKRKPFLTGGYGLSTLAKPLLFLATSYWNRIGNAPGRYHRWSAVGFRRCVGNVRLRHRHEHRGAFPAHRGKEGWMTLSVPLLQQFLDLDVRNGRPADTRNPADDA